MKLTGESEVWATAAIRVWFVGRRRYRHRSLLPGKQKSPVLRLEAVSIDRYVPRSQLALLGEVKCLHPDQLTKFLARHSDPQTWPFLDPREALGPKLANSNGAPRMLIVVVPNTE